MGKHLELQCHIAMTAGMVQKWCIAGEIKLKESASTRALSQANDMVQKLTQHCQVLNKIANQVYTHWITCLKPQ